MRVHFTRRGPEHEDLGEVEMPMPPRIGERFAFDPADAAFTVVSVSYIYTKQTGVVSAEVILT